MPKHPHWPPLHSLHFADTASCILSCSQLIIEFGNLMPNILFLAMLLLGTVSEGIMALETAQEKIDEYESFLTWF